MDIKGIRNESIQTAKQLGVEVPATLPLLDAELEMRSSDETVSRVLAMHAVAASAYGFDKTKAVDWLNLEKLTESLGERERRFVFENVGQPNCFQVQVEGIWALAWAMRIVNELNFAKHCDDCFVVILPNLKQNQSSADFRKKLNPRPLHQVVAVYDLAYCLHWPIRQAQLTGKQSPGNLNPNLVVERRRALEWLLNKDAWDDVPLDT